MIQAHVKSSVRSPLYVGSHIGTGLNSFRRPVAKGVPKAVTPNTVTPAGVLTGTGTVQRVAFGKATRNGIPPLALNK